MGLGTAQAIKSHIVLFWHTQVEMDESTRFASSTRAIKYTRTIIFNWISTIKECTWLSSLINLFGFFFFFQTRQQLTCLNVVSETHHKTIRFLKGQEPWDVPGVAPWAELEFPLSPWLTDRICWLQRKWSKVTKNKQDWKSCLRLLFQLTPPPVSFPLVQEKKKTHPTENLRHCY